MAASRSHSTAELAFRIRTRASMLARPEHDNAFEARHRVESQKTCESARIGEEKTHVRLKELNLSPPPTAPPGLAATSAFALNS